LRFVVLNMSETSERIENNPKQLENRVQECSLNDKLALPYAGAILVGGLSFLGALIYHDEINYPVLIVTGIGVAVGAVSGYIAHRLIERYIVKRHVARKI